MNAGEFMRRVKKLADRTGRKYHFVGTYGKGSHGRLYLDAAFTTVKDRKKELGAGLLRTMCEHLGIDPKDLQER